MLCKNILQPVSTSALEVSTSVSAPGDEDDHLTHKHQSAPVNTLSEASTSVSSSKSQIFSEQLNF